MDRARTAGGLRAACKRIFRAADVGGLAANTRACFESLEARQLLAGVDGFTLINADTDLPIRTLTDGAVINLAELSTDRLNVRADTDSGTRSVRFNHNGKVITQFAAPYAVFNDTKGDYHPWTPSLGAHTLSAEGFSGTSFNGTMLGKSSIRFTVVDEQAPAPQPDPVGTIAITGVSLVNATNQRVVGQLLDGQTIDFAALGTNKLSVRVDTTSAVESVKFGLDNKPTYRIESHAPYAIAGDNSSGLHSWTPSLGVHTLTLTPYSQDSATGTAGAAKVIRFTVVDGSVVPDPDPQPDPPPPPAPTPGNPPGNVTVANNRSPVVSLVSPTAGTYAAPGYYVVRASAADYDGRVARVDFYSGSTLIGTSLDAPYSIAWTNVSPGTYTLKARAIDNKGAAVVSSGVTLTVAAPQVSRTLVVSTSGSDSNPGTSDRPLRTIDRAADLAVAGDTVLIKPGTYREGLYLSRSGTAEKPITFKAETPGTVVIDGSTALGGWTRDGSSNIYSTAWAHDFYISRNSDGSLKRYMGLYPPQGYVEQVFYNGNMLTQVEKYSDLQAGSFYINWDTDKMSVWLPGNATPSSSNMKASTEEQLMRPQSLGSAKYIHVDGITFRHAANFPQRGAISTDTGWRLSNIVVERVESGGVTVKGDNVVLINVTAQDNGQTGVGASGTKNALLINTITRRNNTKGFAASWEAGGGKYSQNDGTYLLNHQVYDNVGLGIWFDYKNTNFVIDNATVYGQKATRNRWEGGGIFLEINDGPGKIINSTMYNNDGSGLTIAETAGITVRNNTFYGNMHSLEARNMAGRGFVTEDLTVVGNRFKAWDGKAIWIPSTTIDRSTVTIDYNVYDTASIAANGGSIARFSVDSDSLTSFRSIGFELNGSSAVVSFTPPT